VGPRLFFQRVPEGKTVKNRVHLDVSVGTGLAGEERLAALEAEGARLVALGAARVRPLRRRRSACWHARVERFVDVTPGVRLWVEESGREDGSPLLLVMGANASGMAWPDELVRALGERHHVVRYDHRDTGRSTFAFEDRPYAVRELAEDAVRVLDALGIARAHVVGMSMGGTLAQLLLLDHPDRLLSAAVFATAVLEGAGPDGGAPAPFTETDPRLLELWQHFADPRDRDAEVAWRVEHWRLLIGNQIPFDPEEFRRLEERVIDHAGRHDNPAARARADQAGLDRGAELAGVTVPTLVVEAPDDPINPPPAAARIAAAIPSARLVQIPGMGHALPTAVLAPLADAVLSHTSRIDSAGAQDLRLRD
jgi:pimeloyl-ACP methyl ester carboxylesterase